MSAADAMMSGFAAALSARITSYTAKSLRPLTVTRRTKPTQQPK
ncbi:hypothetical protein BZL30_1484 [Mycobacterium kansasii]|uniref:Uncharacterized protein n=1 Tax=Mycobacterium kansasii TaxID=1768 RepID=A0A1V3XSI4_MYCKA|nr:hypothetical protein BZL30_1484 [Mycobacterium kansasii]